MADFDRIARHYDSFGRFVFGKNITDCQTFFLSTIPNSSNILILGGGSGWILNAIEERTKGCRIWYVELSQRMIDLAKSCNKSPNVIFIRGDECSIPEGVAFDVIITNFFLDLFNEDQLQKTVQAILPSMRKNTIWLVSDFVNRKAWHRAMVWIMYRFFMLTTNLETSSLPGWESLLHSMGFNESQSRYFYGSFIKSVVYKRDHF
jgi:SAM-dependent methyltransferase